MIDSRAISPLSSLLFGAVAFFWTVAGETSNPTLGARELPPEVTNECASECANNVEYRSRWIGLTSQGDLFIVGRSGCAPGKCTYWLVERGSSPARTLLELDGAFTLHRLVGRYPVVELRTRMEQQGTMHARFEWNGEQYARTSTERVYEVNGVECGTREECGVAAERALNARQIDRALRIWQHVHGVSWI